MFRALVVLTLILHGAALTGFAPDAAAAAMAADHCPEETPADCCAESDCACGCAATAMMPFTAPRPSAAWDREPSRLSGTGPESPVRLSAAPFRPPA
jgi:hypothetical protein